MGITLAPSPEQHLSRIVDRRRRELHEAIDIRRVVVGARDDLWRPVSTKICSHHPLGGKDRSASVDASDEDEFARIVEPDLPELPGVIRAKGDHLTVDRHAVPHEDLPLRKDRDLVSGTVATSKESPPVVVEPIASEREDIRQLFPGDDIARTTTVDDSIRAG